MSTYNKLNAQSSWRVFRLGRGVSEYKWKALTVTTIGTFMAYLDSSIIIVGLPTVIADLNTSLFSGIWVIMGALTN